ncbi:MAG: gliding motility-associated protein GldE [Muribaculaceae bacterium]|nr:gliding motility-associated protein GldE [Muribaculaceae bacterium]
MDPDPLSCLLSVLCTASGHPLVTLNAPTGGSIIAIIVALLGLFLSAFNSGSEIAYFSLRPDDVDTIEDAHRRERVRELLANPEKLLATVLVGNNLVNIMIAIVLNYAMNQMFDFNSTVLDFLVQTVILTFLILLFGEVIPKLYATNFSIKFAALASAPLKAAVKLFSPLTALLVRSTSLVNKVVSTQTEEVSVDDLTRALEVSEVKNPDEKELLEGILSFGDKTVSDIMRPRVDVVDIDQDDDFDQVVRKVIDTGYSRMPVYEETPDNIKGILYAKDLLPYIGTRDNTFKWQTLMRPAYFVPETRMLDDLLEDFRQKKMHMAIIVDEYGCTQGIATLEDVLEEIVGDINDEYDTEEKFYNRISKDTWLFDGKTLLSDFARVLDIDEEELGEHAEEAETIAGYLLDLKGEFLQEKEVMKYERFTFTVIKVVKHRIAKVKVTLREK